MKARKSRPAGDPRRAPRSRPAAARAWWRHPAPWSALLAAALFAPTLPHAFVWDDHALIEENALLRSPAGVARLAVSDFALPTGKPSGQWRPWIVVSYAVDGALSGWRPAGPRAMNVLAHAGASALVAALALQWGGSAPVALLAGLGFAALPAHVESVAWIAGRTDVYATLFALLALWLDRRARRSGRRWCGPLPLAALALALLSKEIAAGTVLLVALAEWLDAGRTRASLAAAARWVAPHAALTAAVLLAHAALVRTPEAGGWLGELARTRGGWAAARLVPAYLAFLWPGFPHSPAVTLELPEAQEAAGALGLALSLALLAAVAVAVARRHPLALPGALALVGLAPLVAAGLLEGYVLYAERHFYLASAGAAWALAAAVGLAPGRARAPAALLLAAGIAWSAAVTLEVGRAWADDATLFERMSRDHPRNYMARIQWARLLADAGREAEALAQIEAAERLDPRRPDAAGVRAVVLARRGDWAGSLRAADRSIAAGSAEREPRLQRVAALLGLGRWDEARADLERLRSGAAPVAAQEALWGQYLVAAGRADEARAALAAAGARFPHDPDLAYTRGIAEAASDRPREAAAAFERAVELKPGHYDAWLQLAIARALTEDRAGARAALARAARLPGAADGRAAALERMLAGAR